MKVGNFVGTFSAVIVVLNSLGGTSLAAFKQSDSTPPTLVIRSPLNGEIFTKNPVVISGKATDDGTGNSGISSVTVNGARANNDTATGTGIANWSLSLTLLPGSNTITVVAKDASPNQNATTQTISVTFQPPVDDTPPLLDIASPEDDETLTQSMIAVSGKATDEGMGDNGISSVTVNGVRANDDTAMGAGVANWNRTITLKPGPNIITVIAKDASSNQNPTTKTVTVTFIPPVASVSAASYSPAVASDSIVAAFGADLATMTQAATTIPLPTSLAGTTVKVIDSLGTERLAPLFFISPAQVNYQIPPATATGTATVTITNGDGAISTGTAQIEPVAPGLFAANANGQGVAAALALRVKADGSQIYEPIAQFDPAQNKFVSVPIDLGPSTDTMFLILYGTGIRFRSSLTAVLASIGGANAQVEYVGPAPGFIGLDQVNVRLPRSLIGRGEVDLTLTVDGQPSNAVRINIR